MKKIITFFFAAILLCNSPFAMAQSTDNDTDEGLQSRQIGLTFSTLGGPGITFLFPLSGKDNFKLSGIYVYSNNSGETESFYSLGAEYQRDLYETQSLRGHFLLGGHVDNSISHDLYFDYTDKGSYFNMGIGLGFDFGSVTHGLILNGHLTYQLTSGIMGNKSKRVGLAGGFGIGFNF